LGEVEAAAAAVSKSPCALTVLTARLIPPDRVLKDPRFGVQLRAEAVQASQPCTVEAMYKADWPTRKRSTEAEQAALETLERAAIQDLRGSLLLEEAVESPEGPGVIKIEGAGDVAARCKGNLPTYSISPGASETGVPTHLDTHHPKPPVQWQISIVLSHRKSETKRGSVASSWKQVGDQDQHLFSLFSPVLFR
jgi:hypothetical protein